MDGLEITMQFYPSLFVKSTEPTNIFKSVVKETGQSAPAIDGKHDLLTIFLPEDKNKTQLSVSRRAREVADDVS